MSDNGQAQSSCGETAMATFTSSIGFLGAVALAAAACAVPALGQSFDIRTLFSAPAAEQRRGRGAHRQRHPGMERRIRRLRPSADDGQAIRAAAANFRNCLAGLWPQAQRRGVPRAVFDG